MKKLNLLLTTFLSCWTVWATGTPVINAHVCQVDNFLAGCTVFPRAEGDQAGVPVDIGGTTYNLYLSWGTPAEFAYTDSIAVGGTYIFNCQVLTEAGTYTETLTKADGCDSIVTLTLTEYIPCQDVTFAYTDSVKVGGSYLFGCDVVTLDGKTQDTFTRVEHLPSGCDSIITLTLKEYIPCQDVTFAYTDSVKVGGIYLFGCDAVTLDGKTDSTFTRVEHLASGCDSVITLTLKEYIPCQDVTFAYTDSVAVGGIYLFGCDAVTLDGKTDSTFTRVEHLASGCDSIITLTLKEYIPCQDVTFAYTDSVKVGGTYLFGCDAVTLDGKTDSVFTRVEHLASGCDSVITLTLKEYIPCQDVTFAYTDSVKVGGSYLFGCDVVTLDGKTDSVFTRVEHLASGCDSIVTLTLKEYAVVIQNDTLRDTISVNLCYKEPFTDRLGKTYYPTQDSIVLDTIMIRRDTTPTLIHTVDSIYRYELTVNPVYTDITDGTTICASELPYTWQDTTWTVNSVADTYVVVRNLNNISSTGCDSIVTFTLTINPVYTDITDGATICASELPYTWQDTTWTVNSVADTYVVVRNLNNISSTGCDSIVTFTLTINPVYTDITDGTTICASELPYTWQDTTWTVNSVADTYVVVRNLNNISSTGCDSVVTFTLTINSVYVDNLPALVKDDSWLLMINRRSIREDYGINFTADQVHWYKVVGEVDEKPFGEDNDTEVGTGDYYTVAAKMSGKYYALLDVDVSWKASCALYARTVILDCDNPQPVGPVLSPTFVSPGGLMKLTNLQQGETQLNVISPAGQLIRTEKVMNETEHELHAESVCGFYLLQVLNGGQKYVFKYVVTH